MSNLIIELPIDEFYNPTPNEINTINTLIPDKEKMSYTEHIILSSITSNNYILSKTYYKHHHFNNHILADRSHFMHPKYTIWTHPTIIFEHPVISVPSPTMTPFQEYYSHY